MIFKEGKEQEPEKERADFLIQKIVTYLDQRRELIRSSVMMYRVFAGETDLPIFASQLVEKLESQFGQNSTVLFLDESFKGNYTEVFKTKKIIVVALDYEKFGEGINRQRPLFTEYRPEGSITIFVEKDDDLGRYAVDLVDFASRTFF